MYAFKICEVKDGKYYSLCMKQPGIMTEYILNTKITPPLTNSGLACFDSMDGVIKFVEDIFILAPSWCVLLGGEGKVMSWAGNYHPRALPCANARKSTITAFWMQPFQYQLPKRKIARIPFGTIWMRYFTPQAVLPWPNSVKYLGGVK